ncbi:MAG TPA: MFS transporter [Streptosporangiaceae bacterium]|nr:MFS transporter [Streptosporangiaceae bacterium]
MTRVEAAREGRNPYLVLLRTPGALGFSASAFVGRMSMSMYGLGTVLLLVSLTGHYGAAGTVAGAGSIGYSVLSPYIAKLADRFGQGRVLLSQVVVFTIAFAIFIACAQLRAPFAVLLVTGVVAGAFMPSMNSMVRTRWSWVLGGDTERLHSAFALESVNDELIFVIGPALVTLLATQVFAASGVGTASLLAIAGTLVFALQRRTEPVPRPEPRQARSAGRTWRVPSLPAAGLVTLSPAFLALGAMFTSVDLSTVAFATEHGHKPLAGLVLGTYALGSAIGGLWYGSRRWRAPLGRRFVTTTGLAAAGAAIFIAMPGLLALDAACLVAGMAIAPTLIAGYAILEQQAPPHRTTEAMAWLGSTISVGVAVGSAVVGHLIDAAGARAGYVFAACCGALAVTICLAGRRRLGVSA